MVSITKYVGRYAFGLAALVAAHGALAGSINQVDGVALHGFDPVAYFTQNKAVKGVPDYSAKFGGATFEFETEADKKLFEANPAKYAPAYGGFCAFGVTEGLKIDADPHAYLVENDKLLVFFSDDARTAWQKSPKSPAMAEAKWPEVQKLTKVIH